MATKGLIIAEIEQYQKTFGVACSTSEPALKKLLELCDLMDSIADEFDAEDIYFTVDPKIKHGYVHAEVIDLVFSNGRSHYFFDGVKAADFVGFEKSRSGNLRLSLGVKDLWVTQ